MSNANFVEQLISQFGPEILGQLGSTMNIPENSGNDILKKIAPLILGGLKRQGENHGGQPRVEHILNKYGDPSHLDDISGVFKRQSGLENPDPQLGGLLGVAGSQAAEMLEKQFGLQSGSGSQLINMLAPIVLGALSRQNSQGGVGGSSPAGGLMGILDRDGDGNVLDDVAGMLFKEMASGGRGSSGGGLLGNLLGSIFGKK